MIDGREFAPRHSFPSWKSRAIVLRIDDNRHGSSLFAPREGPLERVEEQGLASALPKGWSGIGR
jgi:hypothetical protein